MRFPSLSAVAFGLLLAGGLLSSCDEKDPATPAPQQPVELAVLSGQITPAQAVSTVTATDKSGRTLTATPGSTGAYAFAAAAPGEYTLRFAPTAEYLAPEPVQATLVRGGTVVATTAQLAPASATIEVDGVPVTHQITVEHLWYSTIGDDSYIFYLAETDRTGDHYPYVQLSLNYTFDNHSGPDTNRVLPLGDDGYGALYNDDVLIIDAENDYPRRTGGTLTTTSVNREKHVFSGYFEFKAGNYNKQQNYVTKTIKGRFVNLPYEVARR
ncbi:hypothetical protein FY528_12010 [Hymenobacter lutimineralis]|uniref:Carboxypeptidase regulatory-like domain-containing protein n=1 Tax=Hymenobacter lutimineralis TaxID=2606448 RepID=A0A5D6V1T4_9BACT|nr:MULTISPECIES: hypothetical protein [Hymenobacter]QIX61365.1 hypothetical protein HER32_09315 [Hymenobacter sp. BT18]TYZ08932.1 hypothetical protein FY528_12010 [Hymenobacter lutimineralis]